MKFRIYLHTVSGGVCIPPMPPVAFGGMVEGKELFNMGNPTAFLTAVSQGDGV
jgi:hypothetical protein